jgi:hypothetical protein
MYKTSVNCILRKFSWKRCKTKGWWSVRVICSRDHGIVFPSLAMMLCSAKFNTENDHAKCDDPLSFVFVILFI